MISRRLLYLYDPRQRLWGPLLPVRFHAVARLHLRLGTIPISPATLAFPLRTLSSMAANQGKPPPHESSSLSTSNAAAQQAFGAVGDVALDVAVGVAPDVTEVHASLVAFLDQESIAALHNRHLLIAICGGIATYKVASLVSALAQGGAKVTVAMTEAATRFISPLTMQSLSGRAVHLSVWDTIDAMDPQHISLARSIDAAVVAPCTMDAMARLATGRADDVVTLLLSAIDRARVPVLLAPAMNEIMWNQPATQRNAAQLAADGFEFVGPGEGWQACRTLGVGRMSEPLEILAALLSRLKMTPRRDQVPAKV